MKKILIVSFTSLKDSKRPYRQIKYLKDKYDIYTLGFDESGIEGIPFYKVCPVFKKARLFNKLVYAFLFFIGKFEKVYEKIYDFRDIIQELTKIEFDLIIVHDLKPLPLVYKIKKTTKMIFDAHEYYFDLGGFSFINYFFLTKFDNYLIKEYLSKFNNIITVSNRISKKYEKKFNKKIEIVTNYSEYHNIKPTLINFNKIRMIHHGMADKNRKIQKMIEMMDYVDDRFELDLMMTTTTFDNSYLEKIKSMCIKRKNVRVIAPVDSNKIITYINKYDIGLYILSNNYTNQELALPNKFFEFIQARLMLAISPNPEMADMVKKYDIGVVADDYTPKNLAQKLNSLSAEQIMKYKQNANLAASELNSENEMEKLKKIVENIIGD